jgi:hypothetical protein
MVHPTDGQISMSEKRKNPINRAAEQPAVRTTIVGGRPPGPGKSVGAVPRGIEVLVKKAAVDPGFKALLLAERSAAAAEIGLELSDAEVAMLDGVPVEQLEAIIANTTVSPKIRPAFMGRAAAVMLAALGTTVVTFAEQVEGGEAGVTTRDDEPVIEADETYKVGVISGTVTDEEGNPIEGALVVVKGADLYVQTNEDGYYKIQDVPEGSYEIKANRVGYAEMIIVGVPVITSYLIKVNFLLKDERTEDYHIAGIRPLIDFKETSKDITGTEND